MEEGGGGGEPGHHLVWHRRLRQRRVLLHTLKERPDSLYLSSRHAGLQPRPARRQDLLHLGDFPTAHHHVVTQWQPVLARGLAARSAARPRAKHADTVGGTVGEQAVDGRAQVVLHRPAQLLPHLVGRELLTHQSLDAVGVLAFHGDVQRVDTISAWQGVNAPIDPRVSTVQPR
eukprot:scaffold31476_cov121-Isochrysis_galbana.AAC.1